MGFIGKDRTDEDAPTWFPTAPTATEEKQDDVVTTHDVTYSPDGIACCSGVKEK